MKERMHFSEADPLVLDPYGNVRLKGSRVTLATLIANFKKGDTPEQLRDAFPSLSLEQINGAIEWYRSHRPEAEAYFKEYYAEGDRLRREIESQPGYQAFREKILSRRKQLNKT
jgi:uncharacterized protein (DUF433 family)